MLGLKEQRLVNYLAKQNLLSRLLYITRRYGGIKIENKIQSQEGTDLLVFRLEEKEYVFEQWSIDGILIKDI